MGKEFTKEGNSSLQVVASPGGKESAPPPLVGAIKDNSDSRMSQIMRQAQRRQGVVPNSAEKDEKKSADESKKNSEGAAPTTDKKSEENKETSSTKSKEGQPEKKDESAPAKDKKSESKVDWEVESKNHQSRADKLANQIKDEYEPERIRLRKEVEELTPYRARVEDFTKNPVEYIMTNLPNLARELANAGDPLKMVENEVSKFKTELDKQFSEALGSDWKYNSEEAMIPGSPSFRYRLSLEDKISETKDSYRRYVETKRKQAEDSARQIEEDKKRLKEEFGLTEEDFKTADEWLSKNRINYYSITKAIMIDKILQSKLAAIVPAPPAPPDIASTGKGADESRSEKKKVSKEGAAILARLGRSALSK